MAKWLDRIKDSFHLINDDSGRATDAPARPLLSRSTWWLLLILILWLPISPFIVTVSGWRPFSAVREILTVILLVQALVVRRRNKLPLVAGDLERLIVWMFGWSLLCVLIVTRDPLAWVWSARYSLLPLAIFWSLHSYSATKFQWRRLLTIWLSWSGLIFIFGLLMVSVIPKETLVSWGYSASVAIGGGQWVGSAALPAYQAVAGGLPRLQGTLTGPIQLAGFAALVFWLIRSTLSWQPTWLWRRALAALTVITILGTFSRSIWLALLLIGLVAGYQRLRARGLRKRDLTAWGLVIGAGAFMLLGLVFMSPNNENLRFTVGRVLAREGSDSEHAASIKYSLADWKKVGFFGIGYGRSGPGAIQYAAANTQAPLPRFVDNSYLRWWEEGGYVAAGLFLAFIWILISDLRRAGPTARYLSRAGLTLALAALLTDMWSEAVPVITLFALAALWHSTPEKEEGIRQVGPFRVTTMNQNETVSRLLGWLKNRDPHAVVTLNPEMYVASRQSDKTEQAIAAADLITADGAGILAAADVIRQVDGSNWLKNRWLRRLYLPFAWVWSGLRLFFTPGRLPLTRVTGTDIVRELIDTQQSPRPRLALLGSTKETLDKIKDRFNERPTGAQLVLAEAGPQYTEEVMPEKDAAKLVSALKPVRADVLFVAFGVPKQERFIVENKRALAVPVMVGVSGAFDSVLAGTVKQPPRLFRFANLEWLWRLLIQPKRIGRIWTATWRFMRVASRDIVNS